MRIHVANPNTTASMTATIRRAAEAAASLGTTIVATQPDMGPVSIEGHYDAAFATPGLLGRIREAEAEGASAHVIACFDDTGLDAARALASAPVVGIGEAACHVASLLCDKLTVITTLGRSIPVIEHNLVRYGLATRVAKVRAVEVAVLALEDPKSGAEERLSAEIEVAKREDRAEAIVLGCAGMAELAARLAMRHGLPVVEGISAAVMLAEGLARLGLRTSKLGGYARPLPKAYAGAFAAFAPG